MDSLGSIIKEARNNKKITTTKLAEIVGVTQGYISHLENNRKKKPSPDILKNIAEALDISYLELMKDTGYLDKSSYNDILGNTKKVENLLHNSPIMNFSDTLISAIKRKKLSFEALSESTNISVDRFKQLKKKSKISFSDKELLNISKSLDYPFVFLFLLANNMTDIFGIKQSKSYLNHISVEDIQQTRNELIIKLKHFKSLDLESNTQKEPYGKLYGRYVEAQEKYEKLSNIVRLDNFYILATFSGRDSESMDLADVLTTDETSIYLNNKQLSPNNKRAILNHLNQIEMQFED